MATKKFTAREMDQLRESPYVLDVTQSIVHFSAQFKALFYEGLQAGKAPAEIVMGHGIDPEILGVNRVNGLKNMVLKEVKAGKGFRDLTTYGTYLEHLLTPEAKIRLLEQEMAYKDQVIEYLKKNCVLRAGGGRMMDIPANAKYAIIRETSLQTDNLLSIKQLCSLAGVSRSGYYHYLSTEENKQRRERQDQEDFRRIVEAYQFRGYAKGARRIYMRLIHMNPPMVMNIKKIRRLMRKYGLKCPIRKANPYRRMAKALKTSYVAPNLLNREFETHGPRAVLLTDITYISNGKAPRCYLSAIIDACTKELLAWVLSESLEVGFVLETVNQLMERHGPSLQAQVLIHSDQGAHYTSVKFVQLAKDSQLRQSMSRRANCWDNAPQESFFGHMKDEIDLSACTCFEHIHQAIRAWADYYNNERYQWDLARLAPAEYYRYLMTGKYPLSVPPPKTDK